MNPTNRPLGAVLDVPGSGLLRLVTLLAAATLLLGACTGGDEDSASDTAAQDSVQESIGASAGNSGPTGATGPASSTGPAGATGQPPGVATPPANALTELDSFRFEVSIQGTSALVAPGATGSQASPTDEAAVSARGAWLAPDKAQLEMDIAGTAYKQTVIGNQEWTSLAGVEQGPAPATVRPQDLVLVSAFPTPDAIAPGGFDCGGAENINGVDTTRCDATDSVKDQVLSGFGGGQIGELSAADITMWVADDGGYVVKMALTASGTLTGGQDFSYDLQANITDINNVGNIEP